MLGDRYNRPVSQEQPVESIKSFFTAMVLNQPNGMGYHGYKSPSPEAAPNASKALTGMATGSKIQHGGRQGPIPDQGTEYGHFP